MRVWPIIFAVTVLPIIVVVVCALLMWSIHLWNVPPWCVVLVGIVLTLGGFYSAWYAAQSMAARRFRFRLRTFFVVVAAIAVILVAFFRAVYPRLSQGYAVQDLAGSGGYPGRWVELRYNWLATRLGYDPFDDVDKIEIRADRAIPTLLSYKDQFSTLEQLSFDGGVTDAALTRASEFNSLAQLRCGEFISTPLTDNGLLHVKDWTRVRCLFFNGCAFTDKGLAHLTDLPELESLTLIGNEGGSMAITDAGMVQLGNMSGLKDLRLQGVPVTDAGLAHLKKLNGLEKLIVLGTAVTESGLDRLRHELPDCWMTGMNDLYPTVNQIERVCVRQDSARDGDVIEIHDEERIAKIKACLERYVGQDSVGWLYEWEPGTLGGIRVDFEQDDSKFHDAQSGE